MTDDAPQPVVTGLPIVVGSDGQPYLGCDAVLALLRAVATSSRTLADDPECDLRTLADTLAREVDALEVRAIAHTMRVDTRRSDPSGQADNVCPDSPDTSPYPTPDT